TEYAVSVMVDVSAVLGFMAVELLNHTLVERPFPSVSLRPERVDHAHEGDLCVLSLVALVAAGPRVLASPQAARMPSSALRASFRSTAARMLRRRDHRSAAPVDLDDEYLAVVVGYRIRVEEAAGLGSN